MRVIVLNDRKKSDLLIQDGRFSAQASSTYIIGGGGGGSSLGK